jgi:hypothetical protein
MLSATQVVLPAETFDMRTRLFTLSLEKPKYKAEEILETRDLFNMGDIHYMIN